MRTWQNNDYRDGGVVDILAVHSYSGVRLCMPIFFLGSKSFSKNFKTQMDTSLNKAQHSKSCYVNNIWLW
jgi:hypothetical protein